MYYAIRDPTTQVFNAGTWNDVPYYVYTFSNSTLTDFMFNPSLKQISFNIDGPSGTTGFCNVTIPKDLLAASYSVFADESQLLAFDEQSNATHSFLYFNYDHNISNIRIEGTEAIPEFPSWFILSLIMITTLTMLVMKKHFPRKVKNNE